MPVLPGTSTTNQDPSFIFPSSSRRLAHEAEWIVPGTFVVLQGSSGDGVANTLRQPLPQLPSDFEFHAPYPNPGTNLLNFEQEHSVVEQQEGETSPNPTAAVTTTRVWHSRMASLGSRMPSHSQSRSHSTNTPRSQTAATNTPLALGSLAGVWGTQLQQQQPPTMRRRRPSTALSSSSRTSMSSTQDQPTATSNTQSAPMDDFVVVTDEEGEGEEQPSASTCPYHSLTPLQTQLVEEWKERDRQRALTGWQEVQESARRLKVLQSPSVPQQQRQHAFMASSSSSTSRPMEDEWWWLSRKCPGQLALFSQLPTRCPDSRRIQTALHPDQTSLAPGTTVLGQELIYLNSETLQILQIPPCFTTRTDTDMSLVDQQAPTTPYSVYPKGKLGWTVMLRIDIAAITAGTGHKDETTAYVVLSVDGYSLLAPGLPSWYTDPDCWIWRVTCPAGAFVREGLDLNTHHIHTIPFGSLVQVTQRTLNGQGLCRLRVSALVESPSTVDASAEQQLSSLSSALSSNATDGSATTTPPLLALEGWCSESLNPLSGNRGSVLEPLTFPVPAIYRVILPEGAVIRAGVDLSSPQIGFLPQGTQVAIIGRKFSEHPVEGCLERLQLAAGGWISVKLNRSSPHDHMIVESVGTDSAFDPKNPHFYHWNQQLLADEQQQQHDYREISSVDSDAISHSVGGSTPPSDSLIHSSIVASPGTPRNQKNCCLFKPSNQSDNVYCLICLTEERNATIVHGETGHVACCLTCARILKARGDKCPVCRLPIDLVIQQFWA